MKHPGEIKSRRRRRKTVTVVIPSLEEVGGAFMEAIRECNTTELAEICRYNGLDADCGVAREDLEQMAFTGEQIEKPSRRGTDLTPFRAALQAYLNGNKDLALDPRVCPGDCTKHGDFFVLACYVTNEEKILKFLKKTKTAKLVERALNAAAYLGAGREGGAQ